MKKCLFDLVNCKRVCWHGCVYFFNITFKWPWRIWYIFGQLCANICEKSIEFICYFLFTRYLLLINQRFSWLMRPWCLGFAHQFFHNIPCFFYIILVFDYFLWVITFFRFLFYWFEHVFIYFVLSVALFCSFFSKIFFIVFASSWRTFLCPLLSKD